MAESEFPAPEKSDVVFQSALKKSDDLLLRMRGREDWLRPHAAQLIPPVDTICLSLYTLGMYYSSRSVLGAIEPYQRQLMTASLTSLGYKASAVVFSSRAADELAVQASTRRAAEEIKAKAICELAVHALLALSSLRPLLEQLDDDTDLNRHWAHELDECLQLLDTLVGS